jgi:hypothetical protein
MDFVADQLFDGRRLRALTLVDTYTRERLAIEVAAGLRGEDVVRVIDGSDDAQRGSATGSRRQRFGVRIAGAGSMGPRQRRRTGLLSARQAYR